MSHIPVGSNLGWCWLVNRLVTLTVMRQFHQRSWWFLQLQLENTFKVLVHFLAWLTFRSLKLLMNLFLFSELSSPNIIFYYCTVDEEADWLHTNSKLHWRFKTHLGLVHTYTDIMTNVDVLASIVHTQTRRTAPVKTLFTKRFTCLPIDVQVIACMLYWRMEALEFNTVVSVT